MPTPYLWPRRFATIFRVKRILQQLVHGTPLTAAQSESAFSDIMDGTADPVETASLLTLLAVREPTVDELLGAAIVMRRHAVAIDAPDNVIDTCGTGGTSSTFFNISTAAAIVAAACGVPVCKHGNRSVTSRSGSSDVLARLGVNIDTTPEQESACLLRRQYLLRVRAEASSGDAVCRAGAAGARFLHDIQFAGPADESGGRGGK